VNSDRDDLEGRPVLGPLQQDRGWPRCLLDRALSGLQLAGCGVRPTPSFQEEKVNKTRDKERALHSYRVEAPPDGREISRNPSIQPTPGTGTGTVRPRVRPKTDLPLIFTDPWTAVHETYRHAEVVQVEH